MRKRPCEIKIRLYDAELKKLNKHVSESSLSREAYMRLLIEKYQPLKHPPIDYKDCLKRLQALGVNFNKIAHDANTYDTINKQAYDENMKKLKIILDEMMAAAKSPERYKQ